jgi:lantibiotic modifying enzyme
MLLDDERFARAARALAALLTPGCIARDTFLDVSGGASGAILGLLAAWERAPDDGLLAAARTAAAHLLSARAPAPTGHRVWRDRDGRFATGVSHGAAGHAWALGRLYRATRDRALLDALEEAIAFERTLFSEPARNWPNRAPRSADEPPEFQASWCYGAPGIGLSRLALRDVLPGSALSAEVERAMETTIEAGVGAVDHLCCGNAGRIECLRLAATMLDRPALRAHADRFAAQIVARKNTAGGWSLFDGFGPGPLAPGLFQGLAGIGLVLLSLAGRAPLQSVLLWE